MDAEGLPTGVRLGQPKLSGLASLPKAERVADQRHAAEQVCFQTGKERGAKAEHGNSCHQRSEHEQIGKVEEALLAWSARRSTDKSEAEIRRNRQQFHEESGASHFARQAVGEDDHGNEADRNQKQGQSIAEVCRHQDPQSVMRWVLTRACGRLARLKGGGGIEPEIGAGDRT